MVRDIVDQVAGMGSAVVKQSLWEIAKVELVEGD